MLLELGSSASLSQTLSLDRCHRLTPSGHVQPFFTTSPLIMDQYGRSLRIFYLEFDKETISDSIPHITLSFFDHTSVVCGSISLCYLESKWCKE